MFQNIFIPYKLYSGVSNPVYLGKVNIGWCDSCNVPVLGERCSRCGSKSRTVNVTPPGEFKFPLKGDWDLLDRAFSEILSKKFSDIFSRYVVVLNRIPGPDRMEEVIVGGNVIATVVHEDLSIRVSLRPHIYGYVKDYLRDIFITVDSGAVESIENGSNLMVPGIVDIGNDVIKGRDVFLRTDGGKVFAIGISRVEKGKIPEKGMGVKVKYILGDENVNLRESNLRDAIDANSEFMEKEENRSIEFLRRFSGKNVLVSFSGGKDSLVALHLAMRAGLDFRTVFLNTGLEFEETIGYVLEIVKDFSLKLEFIDAGDAFFRSLDHFGPPGRDYRWCCKVCKLGPTTRFIKSLGEGKIYMVIGQRSYESRSRALSGSIWENEWVPNQIGISPIQKWNSLMVWLYIFRHGLKYNPWYDRGLWRIGCFMCPSQDLGDLEIVSKYPIYERWYSYIRDYAKRNGLDEKWVKYALWRWNTLPPYLKERYDVADHRRESLRVSIIEEGESIRLKTNKEIDIERLRNMKNILPRIALGDDLSVHRNFVEKAIQVIYQSEECVGCGICTGRCEYNALYIKDGRVWVNEERCIHCTRCLGPCPAYVFR
ncbi:MAG: phosphoadenosine phosphosulfate reductase [Aciduliprofundum sp.]|nr:MAG: phosphoadenosine phosphosulfate reductase [Aciduliprofundum sp.]